MSYTMEDWLPDRDLELTDDPVLGEPSDWRNEYEAEDDDEYK
jgi:hypothetical protein